MAIARIDVVAHCLICRGTTHLNVASIERYNA